MTGMIIKGKSGDWEVICGLEIHCQIISKSKMFSGASTHYGSDANENVSFVDAGMPGMLPTLNEQCVRQAVKTGLGLNAQINKYSEFARKNYFYKISTTLKIKSNFQKTIKFKNLTEKLYSFFDYIKSKFISFNHKTIYFNIKISFIFKLNNNFFA